MNGLWPFHPKYRVRLCKEGTDCGLDYVEAARRRARVVRCRFRLRRCGLLSTFDCGPSWWRPAYCFIAATREMKKNAWPDMVATDHISRKSFVSISVKTGDPLAKLTSNSANLSRSPFFRPSFGSLRAYIWCLTIEAGHILWISGYFEHALPPEALKLYFKFGPAHESYSPHNAK